MKLIVCLDNRNGMLFGGRRQSRDRAVCERIASLAENEKLWMNPYSAKLFADSAIKINVDDDFLNKAEDKDFCFVENSDITPHICKINQIIFFKWNTYYPADKHFPNELNADGWRLSESEEFPGFSHEKITMEIYVK